jgi:hypothetical protein
VNRKFQRWPATAGGGRTIISAFAAMLVGGLAVLAADTPSPGLRNAVVWRDGKPVELVNPARAAVDTVRIYQPRTEWTYSHHPHLTLFPGPIHRHLVEWSPR